METQYHKNIINKTIAIFGIIPPPLGGVSVHIKRVTKKFKENGNTVYHRKTEFRGRKYLLIPYLVSIFLFLLRYKITGNKIDLIYYHSSYLPNAWKEIRFLLVLKKIFNFVFVLVEHNCRHMYTKNKKDLVTLQGSIKNIDSLLFMGQLPYKSYIDNNIMLKNYTIDHAFLHPDVSREKEIIETYPQELLTFLQVNRPSLLANASILPITGEKEIYGFAKTIHLTSKLKKIYPKIGVILVLAQIGNYNYFQYLLKLIKQHNLQKNIFFLTGQKELWPLLKKIDIFLRPTLKDGTSVSLQEALWLKTPVIASNICQRPEPTILFDITNDDDFYTKVISEIKNNLKNEGIL